MPLINISALLVKQPPSLWPSIRLRSQTFVKAWLPLELLSRPVPFWRGLRSYNLLMRLLAIRCLCLILISKPIIVLISKFGSWIWSWFLAGLRRFSPSEIILEFVSLLSGSAALIDQINGRRIPTRRAYFLKRTAAWWSWRPQPLIIMLFVNIEMIGISRRPHAAVRQVSILISIRWIRPLVAAPLICWSDNSRSHPVESCMMVIVVSSSSNWFIVAILFVWIGCGRYAAVQIELSAFYCLLRAASYLAERRLGHGWAIDDSLRRIFSSWLRIESVKPIWLLFKLVIITGGSMLMTQMNIDLLYRLFKIF